MKLITKTLAGVASLLLLGQGLNAATVSYSATHDVGASYVDFALNKFNTNLGTLTGVTITVDYSTLQGSFTVTNNAIITATVDSYESQFGVRQSSTNALGYNQQTIILTSPTTTPDWATTPLPSMASQVFTLTTGQNIVSNNSQTIGSGFWSAYESAGGSGSVVMQARDIQSITTTGNAYTLDAANTTAATQLTVTYTYTVVPEPSTVGLLLGAGGLGLVGVVRRRRAAARA